MHPVFYEMIIIHAGICYIINVLIIDTIIMFYPLPDLFTCYILLITEPSTPVAM